jgi:hypothetical protein
VEPDWRENEGLVKARSQSVAEAVREADIVVVSVSDYSSTRQLLRQPDKDRIIRPKVYARIMKAVDEVPMTPESRARVKACMRLQREAGLASGCLLQRHTANFILC